MKQTCIHHLSQILHIEDQGRLKLRGTEMQHFPLSEHAWLLVEGSRIKDFGTGTPPQADEQVDAKGGMLLPCWADSHSHLVYAGSREDEFTLKLRGYSYQQIARQGGGIINSALKLRQTEEETLYQQAAARLNELITLGTGVLEIKSGYGLDTESELKMLRVARRLDQDFPVAIRTSFLGAHAIPPEFKNERDAYLQRIKAEMLPAIAAEKLADYLDVFCEEGYFTLQETLDLMEAGAQYGLPAKLHLNQFTSLGGVPAAVARKARSVDHLEVMEPADIEALAHSDTIATALPGCSHYLGIPYTPARELIDREAVVAVATDFNPGSAPSGNMNLMLALACTKMRLTPEEAYTACTLNGAAAVDLSADYGCIERGKVASFLITKPGRRPASLPYHWGHPHLAQVWLQGQARQV